MWKFILVIMLIAQGRADFSEPETLSHSGFVRKAKEVPRMKTAANLGLVHEHHLQKHDDRILHMMKSKMRQGGDRLLRDEKETLNRKPPRPPFQQDTYNPFDDMVVPWPGPTDPPSDPPVPDVTSAPGPIDDACNAETNAANICLSTLPVPSSIDCIVDAYNEIISGELSRTCNSVDTQICSAVSSCEVTACEVEFVYLINCVLPCDPITCSPNLPAPRNVT